MEYIIDSVHGIFNAVNVPDIANVKFDLVTVVLCTHIILLLFITRKDPYLSDLS
ncbi:hypothetical protein SDC9_155473 [bioreactor metagenome]|uniref:Uncharacterized protein n=1 Tax=bioreactor metagenome TaxID=1076179 RepID=A0A645F3S9_9ZZZZ